jgi:hypothetical protein
MGGKMIQFASVNYPTKMARHQGYRFKVRLLLGWSCFSRRRGVQSTASGYSFRRDFVGFCVVAAH